MQNKKKKIIIGLVVIALVLIAVLVLAPGQEDQVVEEPEEEELTEDEIAVEIEECEKQTVYFQSECFVDLAVLTKDPEICDRVEDIEDAGYESSAYFTNPGVCFGRVGSVTEYDYDLCEEVSYNQDYYDICNGLIAMNEAEDLDDPGVCDRLGDDHGWFGDCLSETIDDESELEICDRVPDELDQETCRNSAYIDLTIDNEDISYCEKIDSSIMKAICQGTYAKHFEDLSVCDGFDSDTNTCVCYSMYFEELNDEACESVSDEGQKSTCYMCKDMDLWTF